MSTACRTSAAVGQSLQKNRVAVRVVAERLLRQVDVDAAGEGVGDDQRRRGEEIRPHLGVDAALEIAVAAQHRRDDEVVLVDLRATPVRAAGRELPMQVVQP